SVMPIESAATLVEVLRQHRLLEPAQLEEIATTLAARSPDPRALAQELLRKNWLTPFQVNLPLQGRVHNLLLGQYVLLQRLGQGGMGQVFLARHRRLDRLVALKVIRPE